MNKKYLIILTLAASAHVHGVESDGSDPTLGKRERPAEMQGQNPPNKRQKTEQQMKDQSNTFGLGQNGMIPIDTSPNNNDNAQNNPLPVQDMASKGAEIIEFLRSMLKMNRDAMNRKQLLPTACPTKECEHRDKRVNEKNDDESHLTNKSDPTPGKKTRQPETDQNTTNKGQKKTNQIMRLATESLQSKKPTNWKQLLPTACPIKECEHRDKRVNEKNDDESHLTNKSDPTPGKKTRQPETDQNTPNKRQKKTNQKMAEKIHASTKDCTDKKHAQEIQAPNNRTPEHCVPAQDAADTILPQALMPCTTESLQSKKPMNQKQLLQQDCTNNRYKFQESTLNVYAPNALQTLKDILKDKTKNKTVEHIVINVSDLKRNENKVTPIISQEDASIINALFARCQQGHVTFKCPKSLWDIGPDAMGTLTHVKSLTFEGTTDKRTLAVTLPDAAINKDVTIQGAALCDLRFGDTLQIKASSTKHPSEIIFQQGGRFMTATGNKEVSRTTYYKKDKKNEKDKKRQEIEATGHNGKIIAIEGELTATSKTRVFHTKYNEDGNVCQATTLRSRGANASSCALTITQDGCIKSANSTRLRHSAYKYDDHSYRHCRFQETEAEGNAELTVNGNGTKVKGNQATHSAYKYNDHNYKHYRFQETAAEENAELTVTKCGDIAEGTGTKKVWHKEYDKDENVRQKTEAEGPTSKIKNNGKLLTITGKNFSNQEYDKNGKLCNLTKKSYVDQFCVDLKQKKD